MAGRIRQDDVEAVRERSDIVKVISGYLQLKKAGADRFVGLCPFHHEKTASFSVSPSKQVYYCFGCGEGGNVFRFLEKMENLSFAETVEKLAADAGIVLRYEGQSQADRRSSGRKQALAKSLADAARLYERMLVDGQEGADARKYLAGRGISKESVERFGVGYAPGYPDFLLKRLTKAYSAELLVEAGLVAKDAGGALRDRFRGRITFPIHDLSGNAIGFGGRLLAGPNAPPNAAKYVNSPETPLYRKGRVLYNLNRAKPDITRDNRVFLVEGYTDVIALDQAGVGSAVATCGTALGEEHVQLLSRFAGRAVLAFDSDEAGARAAERAYQFHERYPLDLSVLVLPEGLDPADFVPRHGGQAFLALLDQAVPLVEYMLDRTILGRDLASLEERAHAVQAGVAIVGGLEDPVRRQEYARLLAGKVGVGESAVLLELDRFVRAGPGGDAVRPREASRVPPGQKVEREALKLLIQSPELCAARIGSLQDDHFPTPGYRKAFDLIRRTPGPREESASGLVARAQEERGEQLGNLVAALAVEPLEAGATPTGEYAEKVFLRLEEFSLSRRIDAMRKQLERLNPVTASSEYDPLFEQLVSLEGARRRVRMAAEAVVAP
jgi:DNA primase